MEVKFTEYRFLRDQLILYKNEDIIPLKHTQALLLDFFLADPHSIHSKHTIMDAVWRDKDVSEQVVFQTISQLRAMFGSDAIKTYSKKGYKWELALIYPSEISDEQPNLTVSETTSRHNKRFIWPVLAAVFLVAVAFYLLLVPSPNKLVALHIVKNTNTNSSPDSTNLADLTKQALSDSDNFSVKVKPKKNSSRQSFAAPKLAWRQSKIPDTEWLLWTETFSSTEGDFLNYGLSNGTIFWQGYLFTKDPELSAQQLSKRLEQLQKLGLFSTPAIKLDISAMSAMKKISPNDPDLLLLLALHYLEVKQYEVAMTYAQKLNNLDNSFGFTPYRAKAQSLINDIHQRHRNYTLAANSLNNMSNTLVETPLWALKYEHIFAKSWVEKEQGNFEAMYKTMESGLKFSQEYADPLMLFELQITYSILAKKAGDVDKKYAHLLAAQALLLEHKLNESNLAVVYYHFAIFTQDNHKSVPYLEKVLNLPRTNRNYWIIDHATELLIDQYIEQQDYHLAQSLVKSLPESPKFLLSRAKLYHATNEINEALSYYNKAFELARLEHNGHLGVHAAFGLFQLTAQHPKEQAEYKDYLDRNAKKSWLDDQMKKWNEK